jgi:pyridoxal phosphate enzyme (YggS family)
MDIKTNITNFKQQLPLHCKLIAVSKTQPLESIIEAYEAGQRVFGENKVQELINKYEALPKDIEWHLIGHLQTNKVKQVVSFVNLIHAVDTFKLLEEINKQSIKINRIVPCLLQLHIAEEESKFGFSEQEVLDLLESSVFDNLKNIRIEGLMGMATFTNNINQVRREFKGLKAFFDKLKSSSLPHHIHMHELSMGMSGDYSIAVEEGSTMIRVGTAIFGQRNYSHS